MKEVRVDPGAIPVKSWASQIEGKAWEQATNLSHLPFAQKWIALMPDAHPGYGMPIGGVLFADKAVVPYAVGVDIGCGVSLTETNLVASDLEGKVQQLLVAIHARVPVGNGPGAQHDDEHNEFDWSAIPAIDPTISRLSDVLVKSIRDARVQLGTLGGGNHFIEIQQGDLGEVHFMLHSGSRSVGKKVCDYWHRIALGLNQKWFSQLPDKELAYLPWETDEARAYFADMTVAMEWAEQNRFWMEYEVKSAFTDIFPQVIFRKVADIHHNYAAWENHFGRNGIVHRKGAVKAGVDDVVLIPGSMGTSSYVGLGLGNPDSFETCQHGAGRARSRGDTRRMTSVEQMEAQMKAAGVTLVTPDHAAVVDESSIAYKDIEVVMADSADLVKPTMKLLPIGVVKG